MHYCSLSDTQHSLSYSWLKGMHFKSSAKSTCSYFSLIAILSPIYIYEYSCASSTLKKCTLFPKYALYLHRVRYTPWQPHQLTAKPQVLVPASPQLAPSLPMRLKSLKSASLLGKACWRTGLLKKGLGQGGSSHTAWQLTVRDSNNRHTCKMLVTFKFTCLAPQHSNSQGA